jgi:NAD(P)-dependent dehydrogenase (short-subunit alcohol dehydrogenase family)
MRENRNYSSSNNERRVAVVTGSSKGIEKAIAMEFANAGYSVIINARNEEELKQAAEDISNSIKDAKRIISIPGDISQEPVCISLIEVPSPTVKQFGRIDVLVNNAGIGGESKKIHELTEKDWDEVIDVNLKGAFLCTREAVKNMEVIIITIIQLSIFLRYTNRHLSLNQLLMLLPREGCRC